MAPIDAALDRLLPLLFEIGDAARRDAAEPAVERIERFGDAVRAAWSPEATVTVGEAENRALAAAWRAIVDLIEQERQRLGR